MAINSSGAYGQIAITNTDFVAPLLDIAKVAAVASNTTTALITTALITLG